MRRLVVLSLLIAPLPSSAQDLVLEDAIAGDAPPYFELPFTVPAGTVEIEVRHDDLSTTNILDWGLRDPERVRGWGGGNEEPAIVGTEAASRSYLRGAIQPGVWAVLIGQALVVESPARYRIEIFFRTAPTLSAQTERSAYAPVAALRSGPAFFAGDFHVHSRESGDARPPLDEIADFARSRGLDFVVLSDHNTLSQLDFIADAQARHPDLLFVPAIELTTYFGHANAIGATEFIDFRVRSGTATSVETMLAQTEAQGAVFAINHPVLDLGNQCLGCAWTLESPADRVGAVELQNGAYSITGTLFFRSAVQFWEALLATGAHVAAIGGSDDHRAGVDLGAFGSPIGSPTTMVYADELSVAAIVAGVAAGRTVVKLEGPSDPMVELSAGAANIGDTLGERTTELRARVTGGMGGTLRFVRNGRVVESFDVDTDLYDATLAITAPPGDVDDRWRAQLDVSGQPRVITSHIFIRATGEPALPDAGLVEGGSADCGCSAPGHHRAGSFELALILLGLALTIRSSRRYDGC